ncbi:unnamed protein product [Cochlearia groenlandica]
MTPIVDLLSAIVSSNAEQPVKSSPFPTEYSMQRLVPISEDVSSGDCGPMTVKFIELHTLSLPLVGMTDDIVDHVRMKYVIDVCE